MGKYPEKPVISYPCSWKYTVIGSGGDRLEAILRGILQERPCRIVPSRTSARGSYRSLRVEITVYSDDDRVGIYEDLRAGSGVKMVL